jgi:hypothetical protein
MQKTPTIAPPPPPTPPALPGVDPSIGGLLAPGLPLTGAQREAIQEARSLLSDQLISAMGRRDDLAAALRTAEGADRAGIEQRLIQLDNRIIRLEMDLAETGRALTEGSMVVGSGTAVQPPFGGFERVDLTAIGVVFTLFVLAPLALAFARLLWKRATSPRHAAASPESAQRLERMEQAIDAVAVEVERISEGQRFVTRILTEGPAREALNAGRHPETIAVPRREGVKVPREEP